MRGPTAGAHEIAGVGNQLLQHHFRSGALRAKLEIGDTHDWQEAQADRIADGIMGGKSPCACGGRCSSCQAGNAVLRRKPAEGGQARLARGDVFGARAGRPLDAGARSFFEPHFGDLSTVRIHDDAEASATADGIGARAYTAGADIGFAAGEYAPHSGEGRRLLAHELAHVFQGGAAVRRQPREDEPLPMAGIAPPRPITLSLLDPNQMCGPNGCFTDEDIYAPLASPDPSEPVMEDDGTVTGGIPVANLGPFVAVATRPPPRSSPQITNPPAAESGPRIVQGAEKDDVVEAATRMALKTGHDPTTFGEGNLAGIDEVTIIAHGSRVHARIGTEAYSADDLAQALVDSGWKGGTVRLVICKTGLCGADEGVFAQNVANRLAALGSESAVIAPVGNTAVPRSSALPQVISEGEGAASTRLQKPGKGWDIFVPQEKPEPFFSPKAWKGAAGAVGMTAAFIAMGFIHARANLKRLEEQRNKTGWAPYGPTGDTLSDIGTFILDPTDEGGRSVPFNQRFIMSKWRQTIRDAAAKKMPGDIYKCPWQTSDGRDPLGDPKYKTCMVNYRKGADGYWSTISGSCTEDDFDPPDLNKVIDESVSDEELRKYLELPEPDLTGGLA